MLVEINGDVQVVWSNTRINQEISSIPEEKLQELLDSESGIIAFVEKELADLTITGRGTNQYGKVTVYCDFELKHSDAESACQTEDVKETEGTASK